MSNPLRQGVTSRRWLLGWRRKLPSDEQIGVDLHASPTGRSLVSAFRIPKVMAFGYCVFPYLRLNNYFHALLVGEPESDLPP